MRMIALLFAIVASGCTGDRLKPEMRPNASLCAPLPYCGAHDWPDCVRGQAALYRNLAEQADDPVVKHELLALAFVCDEVADNIEDHLPGREDHAPLGPSSRPSWKMPPTEAALLWFAAQSDHETQPVPKLNVVPIDEALGLIYRLGVISAN
jgi:hypothetical protein